MTRQPAPLYLVRHALADWTLDAMDPPLSPAGREQARLLAARCTPLPVARVVTSPLLRARQTAAAIAEACGCALQVEPRLGELGPGESRRDFEHRLECWLHACPVPPPGTLWVSHGGLLNALLEAWHVRLPHPAVARDRHGSLLAPGEAWTLDSFGPGALARRLFEEGNA